MVGQARIPHSVLPHHTGSACMRCAHVLLCVRACTYVRVYVCEEEGVCVRERQTVGELLAEGKECWWSRGQLSTLSSQEVPSHVTAGLDSGRSVYLRRCPVAQTAQAARARDAVPLTSLVSGGGLPGPHVSSASPLLFVGCCAFPVRSAPFLLLTFACSGPSLSLSNSSAHICCPLHPGPRCLPKTRLSSEPVTRVCPPIPALLLRPGRQPRGSRPLSRHLPPGNLMHAFPPPGQPSPDCLTHPSPQIHGIFTV